MMLMQAGGIAIGNNSFANGNVVSFGNKGLERRLTNVDKGINDTDAATLANLNEKFADTIKFKNDHFNARGQKISNVLAGEADTDVATIADVKRHTKELKNIMPKSLLDNSMQLDKETNSYYNAKGNRISNLADAKTDTDAVNVKTAKSLINKNVETRLGKINEKSIEGALVIGNNALADHINAIAIGTNAETKGKNSLAFGNDANAQAGGIAIGNNSFANGNVVSFGNKGLERRLTNVDKGINDTDAATLANLNEKFANTIKLDGNGFDAGGQKISNVLAGKIDTDVATIANLNEKFANTIKLDGNSFDAGGKQISNVLAGETETDVATIANLNKAATNIEAKIENQYNRVTKKLEDIITNKYEKEIKISLDETIKKNVTDDKITKALNEVLTPKIAEAFANSLALDKETNSYYNAKGNRISNLADAEHETDAVNVKTAKSLINKNVVETRLGKINEESIKGALVIGNNALADHINAIAIGNAASAKDENSLAFGNNANAQAGGIAIGNNSFANGNVVSFGQKGLERRLTNVAKGEADTDAATIANFRATGLINKDDITQLKKELENLKKHIPTLTKDEDNKGVWNAGETIKEKEDRENKDNNNPSPGTDTESDGSNISKKKIISETTGSRATNTDAPSASDNNEKNKTPGTPRRITNIDDAKASKDGVNLRTFKKELKKRQFDNNIERLKSGVDELKTEVAQIRVEASQAGALGLAVAGLIHSTDPGSLSFSIGTGYWQAEGALAAGVNYTTPNGRIIFKASVASPVKNFSLGASAGIAFKVW
ncbi:YadA-like family protein [Bartonella sp. DGB1]|uniref:YadA-like family protein n=1 Tax=Bartonella sp. DGB1 TaxID=3239807 RepID=UPI0035236FC8